MSAHGPTILLSAYAAAYFAALGTVLGALIWVQIAHISRAAWLLPFRRQLENVAALLPLLAVMFVPLLVQRSHLYAWASHPQPGSSDLAVTLVSGAPSAWLHAGVAFTVWILIAELLRHWSRANDILRSAVLVERQRTLAAVSLPAMLITLTMFAFDFVMTLDEGFRSSIYGLYLFAGASVSALALAAVLGERARRAHALPLEVGVTQFFALAKMLFAMVLFWAYIAFSQLVLVWIANLPSEVGFYLVRSRGPWKTLAVMVGASGFVVPFVFLLSRRFKLRPARVAALGAFVLAAHYVDVAWLVLPPLRPDGPFPALADAGAALAVVIVLVVFARVRARGAAPFAISDPDLERALAFEDA
jgi:hypothetical protein